MPIIPDNHWVDIVAKRFFPVCAIVFARHARPYPRERHDVVVVVRGHVAILCITFGRAIQVDVQQPDAEKLQELSGKVFVRVR